MRTIARMTSDIDMLATSLIQGGLVVVTSLADQGRAPLPSGTRSSFGTVPSSESHVGSSRSGHGDGEVVVELRGIKKRFGSVEVLHGIDLSIHAGEHVVIFGPSGSGKSTLLRSINLLEEPDEGSLRVLGVEYGPAECPKEQRGKPLDLRRQVGMVFQQFNLFPHLTVLGNITLPLRRANGLDRSAAEEKAVVALSSVGMLRWAAHYPAQLSGGQQQRVAIARALSLDPKVMLFDEPTSALDPELVGEVLTTMRKLAETGMTMVVVTHELNFAREIGDFNVFIESGSIVESGGRDLFEKSTNARTREFIGAVL
jgi:ABC-type polar amino acid transport system ATPase subunit